MRDASDAKKGVEAFRARRLGEATVASSRQALYAKNFVQAITEIEEITDNPDVQHDAELFATLMGIKALAYLEMDLHSDARRAASRALDIARGNAIVKAMTEAHLVKRQLDEHAKRERKKWVLDIVNRYLWLIVGASGAGSIYSLGMSFIRTLRGAFYNPNARAGAALPPPPPAEHRNEATP
jgi:hypothetical protein